MKKTPIQRTDNNVTFTLQDVCEICGAKYDLIVEMVDVGILEPKKGKDKNKWQFSAVELNRSKRALRLKHDLELDMQGVALTLELLDELGTLRSEVIRLKRLLNSLNIY